MGQLMHIFIGLRPKLAFEYDRIAHFHYDTDEEEKIELKKQSATSVTRLIRASKNIAKGVNKSVAEKLTVSDYEECRKSLNPKTVTINRIGSDHHNLYTFHTDKIGLSAFDTKRWICDDGISTLAFGHWKTL